MKNDRFIFRIMIGLFLVLLGASMFLNQLGITNLSFITFNFWPIILLIFGIWLLVRGRFVGGTILSILGISFLLSSFFSFSIFTAWPLLIIFFGVMVLFKPFKNWSNTKYPTETTNVSNNQISESIVFWMLEERVSSDNFSGGKIEAVFGGFKLDLSSVKVSKDGAFLEITAVFGGGEIILPKDVRLQLETESVMGGVSNKAIVSGNSDAPLIRIKATAVFGGIEVK